jgi:hypothetical protein
MPMLKLGLRYLLAVPIMWCVVRAMLLYADYK